MVSLFSAIVIQIDCTLNVSLYTKIKREFEFYFKFSFKGKN